MSETVDPRDLILYVRSVEVVHTVLARGGAGRMEGTLQGSGYYSFFVSPSYGHLASGTVTRGMPDYAVPLDEEKSLPDAEAEAVRVAWRWARKHGRNLHVVDVGRETSFHRYLTVHVHHLRAFPVLCRTDGRRLEGLPEFTEENLTRLLTDAP